MAARSTSTVKIVLPSSISSTEASPINTVFRSSPVLRPQQFAPAWFYSALNWLGKSYYDASNVQQSFCNYLAGSDVDPYAKLGATRLFLITLVRETFWLTLAGATALTVKSSSPNNVQGQTSTTYIFDAATVVTIETVAPSAQLGVMSLTYRSSSPASLFANQRIVGFYRDASWKTCLGVPIYDYAGGNIADNEMGKRRVPQPPLPIKRRLPFRPWESIPRCQLPHSRIPSLARAHPVRPPPRLNCS